MKETFSMTSDLNVVKIVMHKTQLEHEKKRVAKLSKKLDFRNCSDAILFKNKIPFKYFTSQKRKHALQYDMTCWLKTATHLSLNGTIFILIQNAEWNTFSLWQIPTF